MDSSLSKQDLSRELANARQNLELMKSQLRAGMVEDDYWMARFEDLARLLVALSEERGAGQPGRLGALYEVSKVLGTSLDLDEVLNQVMDALIQLTGAERGFLMLIEENGELEFKVARNMEKETLDQTDFAISRSVIRAVAETGEQVVTTNATEDPRFASQASVVAHNLRSIQCVPLRARGKIIGVIYVDNRIRSGVFDEADLEMLAAFASQAAMAIENARLFTMTDEKLAARVEELSMMQEIDRQLNETLDFHKVMDLTLEWARRMTQADNGAIGVIDLEEGEVEVVAQQGDGLDEVISLLSGDMITDDPSTLTAPIQREGRVIGIIALNRKDGKAFKEDDQALIMRLADHAAIAIENAQLYEAVQNANNAKTEFVSVVTHELRIPMTAIKGYTDMMLMMGGASDTQKNFLEIIKGNIARMSILVSDLSDISRIESGRINLEIEEDVNLKKVLDEIMPALQAEIEKREHTLVIKVSDDLDRLRADPRRLSQVLINFISNAYKYTPNGGTITIQANREADLMRIDIVDTGVGMTPEELEKLFTKFWRADDLHVREQNGTGLGMVIARNLIELQGGTVDVKSEKNVGTTFSFTVPVNSSAG